MQRPLIDPDLLDGVLPPPLVAVRVPGTAEPTSPDPVMNLPPLPAPLPAPLSAESTPRAHDSPRPGPPGPSAAPRPESTAFPPPLAAGDARHAPAISAAPRRRRVTVLAAAALVTVLVVAGAMLALRSTSHSDAVVHAPPAQDTLATGVGDRTAIAPDREEDADDGDGDDSTQAASEAVPVPEPSGVTTDTDADPDAKPDTNTDTDLHSDADTDASTDPTPGRDEDLSRFPAKFYRNSTTPYYVKKSRLEPILTAMKTCRGTILVTGHTCELGNQPYNHFLARKRARRVASILIEHGLRPGQISVTAAGSGRPIASNETQEGRIRNRRVTVECEPSPRTTE